MSKMVVIVETSEITEIKLGMWLQLSDAFSGSMSGFGFEFVFVHAISDGYASLSNGLTATVGGELVDPANGYTPLGFSPSLIGEATLREISIEEFDENRKKSLKEMNDEANRYAEWEAESNPCSPPENFENGTDDEREVWEDFYRVKKQ